MARREWRRLSYLKNDEFFLKLTAPFKDETSDKSWQIFNDKKVILDRFKELSQEVASFDAALNREKKINYSFYLIEHSVDFKNSVPIGWSIYENSTVRSRLDINHSMLYKNNRIKYVIPPGHFFERRRIETTKKRFCKNRNFLKPISFFPL